MEALREGALRSIEEVFGDRLKRRPPEGAGSASDGALASVFPTSAEEVVVLAQIARRYSVPLTALGAETHPEQPPKQGKILVSFDLMRGHRLPDSDEPWAEAEPGAVARAGQRPAHPRKGPDGLPHERPEGHHRRLAGPGRHRGRLLRVWLVEGERNLGRRSAARRRASDRGRR